MLKNENGIEEDRNVTKEKLGQVSCYRRPISLIQTIKKKLHNRQHTSSKVQNDGFNTKAVGCLSLEVYPNLRDVFTDCGVELDISKRISHTKPFRMPNIGIVVMNGATRNDEDADKNVADTGGANRQH